MDWQPAAGDPPAKKRMIKDAPLWGVFVIVFFADPPAAFSAYAFLYFSANLLATCTPLADACDRLCVTPEPSPSM